MRARASVHWAVVSVPTVVTMGGLGVWAFVIAESMVFMVHDITKTHLILTFFAFGLTALGLLGILSAIVYKLTTEIVITDRKILVQTGWLARRLQEQRLSTVESVIVIQGFIGRLLNVGAVYVRGAGWSLTPLQAITDAFGFRRELQAAMEEAEPVPLGRGPR